MVSRHWKGIAKREDPDRHVAHLTLETFPKLALLPFRVLCGRVFCAAKFQAAQNSKWLLFDSRCKRSEHFLVPILRRRSFRQWHR